jgi:hypothetical protein
MSLSEERIKEFQEIYKKEFGKEISYEEAADSARRLMNLVELMYKIEFKDRERKEKLKDYPKGFYIEGEGYSCAICGQRISNEETWYDKWGIKCLICQKAIDKKIVPGSIIRNKESWYSEFDLEYYFNMNHHVRKRYVKEGILKARTIKNNGGVHAHVFLIKDNKDTLPPKKMVESKLVKEERDGKTYYRSEEWYKFVKDPIKALGGYKIANYLKFMIEQ